MAAIGEYRKKLRGIRSTRQITNAMKMVAGARFARAQRDLVDARKFSLELDAAFYQILQRMRQDGFRSVFVANGPAAVDPAGCGLLLVAADKGLCGDFNGAILRQAKSCIAAAGGSVPVVFAVGRKACDMLRHLDVKNRIEYPNIFNKLGFEHADKIGQDIIEQFSAGKLKGLHVISQTYVSASKRHIDSTDLLPLDPSLAPEAKVDMAYEPIEIETFFGTLFPLWLKSRIYCLLRQSYTAEQGARMLAMDNATRNAVMLIDRTTLEMNKVRQANITRELIEIVATKEVIE